MIKFYYFVRSPPDSISESVMFSGCLSTMFVHPSVRLFVRTDIVTTIAHEHLEQKTDREYSLASTDDLIRFWRSKVKVTASY